MKPPSVLADGELSGIEKTASFFSVCHYIGSVDKLYLLGDEGEWPPLGRNEVECPSCCSTRRNRFAYFVSPLEASAASIFRLPTG